jgi:DNA-3-methyladenine glycosylase I
LEGFQAGLSWLTVLRKRPAFRAGFAEFDPEAVANFTEKDVNRLLADPGIVRHEGKIRSVINNARSLANLEDEVGSFPAWLWGHWADRSDIPPVTIPPTTEVSTALSRRLKKAGFSFVGPTTVYAFMQAMGLVNDHYSGCHVRDACQKARIAAMKSF